MKEGKGRYRKIEEGRRVKLGKTSTSDCSRSSHKGTSGMIRGGIEGDESSSRLGYAREITLDNHKTSQ